MPLGPLILIVLGILFVLAFAIAQALRPRTARFGLAVVLRDPVVNPVSGHTEWYVDLRVEFINRGSTPTSVDALRATASCAGQAELKAKRVLGDEPHHSHEAAHPADISMRLPVCIAPRNRIEYQLQMFFSAHLRRMWDKGQIILYATTTDGRTAKGQCALRPPAVFQL